MIAAIFRPVGFLLFIGLCATAWSTAGPDDARFPLESTEGLVAPAVLVDAVEYRGKRCVRVRERVLGKGEPIVILPGSKFRDGTIRVELAGRPREDAVPAMRGFVGIAFRLHDGSEPQYECFYLRPTNGRADEQLRRNHSAQYASHPAYPWYRLREQNPGEYESYVDLVPGEWTQVEIVVRGSRAELYVHGADQPALIVRDLKGSPEEGSIALWIGDGTEAHFRDLRVTRE